MELTGSISAPGQLTGRVNLAHDPYVHPATHPAAMIVEDELRNFLTEAQVDKLVEIDQLTNQEIERLCALA